MTKKNPSKERVSDLFRNDQRKMIMDYQVRLSHTTNLQAELLALRTGLYLSLQLKIEKLDINFDSRITIMLIQYKISSTYVVSDFFMIGTFITNSKI